jgi:hypothetical protein
MGEKLLEAMGIKIMVPKKGIEHCIAQLVPTS